MSVKRGLLISLYLFLKKINYFKRKQDQANILTFHSINPFVSDVSTVLHLRPEDFDELMKIIKEEYIPLSLGKLIDIIRSRMPIPARAVVITFDDGYLDNFEYAVPILKKYELPACFFLTAGYMNTDRIYPWHENLSIKLKNIEWKYVRSMINMDFEIGAHTVNHVNLAKVPLDIAKREIKDSKDKIEQEIGQAVKFFAYPFGKKTIVSEELKNVIKEYGFECCCSAYGGKVRNDSDLFNLERVSNYPTNIEMLMELDGFMTYYDGKMKINLI